MLYNIVCKCMQMVYFIDDIPVLAKLAMIRAAVVLRDKSLFSSPIHSMDLSTMMPSANNFVIHSSVCVNNE